MVTRTAVLVAVVTLCGQLAAQDPRADPQIAPAALFGEVLRLATLEQWDKVDRVVGLMAESGLEPNGGPLTEPIRRLRERVAARDRSGTVVTLTRLVAARTAELVRQAPRYSAEAERRRIVRQAFTEFVVLSPILKPGQFQLHQQIESGFRIAHGLAGPGGVPFSTSCERLGVLLQRVGAATAPT